MLSIRRGLPLALAAALAALACTAGTANAAGTASAYSAPSGAWSQFTSELSSASGVASGQDVTIAILSDGVDTSAPGLSGKVTVGPRYFGKDSAPDLHSNGTMAAAVIQGTSNVLQGAAPDAKILDLRVYPTDPRKVKALNNNNNFDSTEGRVLAQAITYAVDHGASVIEIDTDVDSENAPVSLLAAISGAVAKGVVITAPSDDSGQDTSLYPQSAPGVIVASSVMLPGGRNPLQNIDPGSPNTSSNDNSVVIAGPGDWVQALPDGWGPYGTLTAVPYVTATAALIKQRYPHLAPALVERALAMSARDKPSGGYSTQVGFGVVDPYDAVLDAATLTRVAPSAAPGPGVAAVGAHFGTGPLPGPVYALPSALWQIILSGAGIVVGAALLAVAALTLRKRRKTRKAAQPDAPEAAPA